MGRCAEGSGGELSLIHIWTSPEQLKADEVLAWSFYYPQYPDAGREPEGEKYGEGIYSQEPYGYLFSQEEVEAYTAQRFGMTAEQTRTAFSYLPEMCIRDSPFPENGLSRAPKRVPRQSAVEGVYSLEKDWSGT